MTIYVFRPNGMVKKSNSSRRKKHLKPIEDSLAILNVFYIHFGDFGKMLASQKKIRLGLLNTGYEKPTFLVPSIFPKSPK